MSKQLNLLLLAVILISFKYSQADITIEKPQDLRKLFSRQNYNINISIGNFGTIPYGKSLQGNVSLAPDIYSCSQIINMTTVQPAQGKKQPKPTQQFILAQRGGCSFIQKAHNAQISGAKLLIIVDNADQQLENIIMIEDGHGDDIHIPTVLISRTHGENLIEYFQQRDSNPQEEKQDVIFTIKFPVTQADIVYMEFWLNINQRQSYKLVREFSDFYSGFNKKNFNLTVHYLVFKCEYCSSSRKTPQDCLLQGKYCLEDPDGSGVQSFGTGRDVLLEIIRQKCIFKINENQWFQYMDQFDQQCIKPKQFEKCSETLQKQIGIDNGKVQKCYGREYKGNPEEQNILIESLQNDLQKIEDTKLILWPSVTVNNVTYRGKLDGLDVLDFVCSQLKKQPKICEETKVLQGFDEFEKTGGANITLIVIVVVIVLILFFFLMILVYKKMVKKEIQRDMPTQVNEMVSQYLAFYETKQSREQ